MKALVLEAQDQGPTLQEREPAPVGPNQVRLRVSAAALNRRDIWIRRGKYPGIKLPIILGSDGCGQVVEAGPGAEEWLGERVICYPAFEWGDDESYQSADFRILGLPDDGTLAEYLTISAENLITAPGHLTDEEAAGLPLAGLTAWRSLVTRGRAKSGDRVLVSGVGGGVALMALQLAVALGAEVYVTSSQSEKVERAISLGARGGVLYTEGDWGAQLREMTPGGFDVVIDGAGGEGFGDLAQALAPGGRLVFYGGTRGKWPRILPQMLFFRQVEILASTMGTPTEFDAMVRFVTEHALKPVVDSVFPLERGAEAFDHLEANGQFGKVVVKLPMEKA